MWLSLIAISLISDLVRSEDPATVRGARGPFRLKFLPVSGDSFQTVSGSFSLYPDPALDEQFEGIKLYLSKALEVEQLTSGIAVADCNGIEITPTYDADLIIVIKNVQSSQKLNAFTCYNQPDGKRNPLVGMIEIFGDFKSLPKEHKFIYLLKRTLKILGFSQNQLSLWRDSNGVAYTQVITTKLLRDVERKYISTPKVVEKTIEAFQYDAGGMELEDNNTNIAGGPDTLAWESRILPYEILSIPNTFMVYLTFLNPYISTITLAMLEDSGWYYPNYNMAQIPLVKRNSGQPWFEETCHGEALTLYPDSFINLPADLGEANLICGILGNSKSFFGQLLQFLQYADTCLIPLDFLSCSPSNNPEIQDNFSFPFEAYTENSRCFNTNAFVSFCLDVISCANNVITFKVATVTYICENEGDQVTVSGLFENQVVVIFCPSYEYTCKETSCHNMCSGRGYCKNSKCICFEGYFGSDCSLPCDISCKECTPDGSACASCHPGFYQNLNACVQCDSTCKTCSQSATFCTSCNNGKYLDSNQCLTCDPKCTICNSLTECTGCATNYHLHNGACCPLNCKTCDSNKCLTCDTHYIFTLGVCFPCPTGCHLCENGECSSCDEGYYKNGATCSQCDTSCLSCATSPNCITCNVDYFKTEDGICIDCPDTCTKCINGVCEDCVEGHHLVGDICCPVGCSTCDLEKCITCSDLYLYIDGECVFCPGNCVSCENGLCIGCEEGYYARNRVCEPCINGCAQCSDAITCSNCLPPYVKTSADTCEKRTDCPFNGCNWCTESVCFECKAGFYLSSGNCYPCATGCLFCNGIWECVACSNEYTKVGGSCCDKKRCKNCTPFGCTLCKPMFLLTDGICENCPDHYENRGNSICERCLKGSYYNGASCISCPSNCLVCKLEGTNVVCYSCKGKSRLTNGNNCQPI